MSATLSPARTPSEARPTAQASRCAVERRPGHVTALEDQGRRIGPLRGMSPQEVEQRAVGIRRETAGRRDRSARARGARTWWVHSMSTQLVLSTVGCLLAAATLLAEDAPYAECRYLRAAGQVQITMGFMDRTADLDSRKAALERNRHPRARNQHSAHVHAHRPRRRPRRSSPPFRSSLQSATAKAARRRSPTSESCWTERHWLMRRCRAAGAASIGSSSIPPGVS